MALAVNGEPIPDAEIRLEANRLRPEFDEEYGQQDAIDREMRLREAARENLIERVLMAQAAEGDLPALTRRIFSAVPQPVAAEMQDFYRRNRNEFWMPETIHAAHIVTNVEDAASEVPAREAMEAVLAEIQSGADFAEVANRASDCPGEGGDLGWFPRGHMVPEFDDVVFALGVGKTSGVFRTPFGFHIARVFGQKPAGIPRFRDISTEIEEVMLRQRKRAALEAFIAGLRKNAKIEKIHESLLHSQS